MGIGQCTWHRTCTEPRLASSDRCKTHLRASLDLFGSVREAAKCVACPKCNARPCQPCAGKSKARVRKSNHQERIRAYWEGSK